MRINIKRPHDLKPGTILKMEDPGTGRMRWWEVLKVECDRPNDPFFGQYDDITFRRTKKPSLEFWRKT